MVPPRSPGTCYVCNENVKGDQVEEHLRGCLPALGWTAQDKPGILLRIMDKTNRRFWLMVLAGPDATLKDLDRLLRDVWVGRSHHLSAFSIGYIDFNSHEEGNGLHVYIRDVLQPGDVCMYNYDFGAMTRLRLSALCHCATSPPDGGLVLLGQSKKAYHRCKTCSNEAIHYLIRSSDLKIQYYCDECAMKPRNSGGWLHDLGNSPRAGARDYLWKETAGRNWHPDQISLQKTEKNGAARQKIRRYSRDDVYTIPPPLTSEQLARKIIESHRRRRQNKSAQQSVNQCNASGT